MPVLTPLRWAVLTYLSAHSGLWAQSSAAPRWPRGWRGWEDHCDSGRESGGGFAAPPPRHTHTPAERLGRGGAAGVRRGDDF